MDSQPTPPNPTPAGERSPGVSPEELRAEAMPAGGREAPGQVAEPGSSAPAQSVASAPPVLSAADVAAAIGVTPTPQQQSASQQGPALAGDVDVIEPEWVDKAEDVVKRTQGDPYREEEDIEDLQQDYLLKRYG